MDKNSGLHISLYARINSLTKHETKVTLKTLAKFAYLSHSLTKHKTKATLIIVSKITCIFTSLKVAETGSCFSFFSFSPRKRNQNLLSSCCLCGKFVINRWPLLLFFNFFTLFFFLSISFFVYGESLWFSCPCLILFSFVSLLFSFLSFHSLLSVVRVYSFPSGCLFSFFLSLFFLSFCLDLNYCCLFFLEIANKQIGNFWSDHLWELLISQLDHKSELLLKNFQVCISQNLPVSLLDH